MPVCYTLTKFVARFLPVAGSELGEAIWCIDEKPQYSQWCEGGKRFMPGLKSSTGEGQ